MKKNVKNIFILMALVGIGWSCGDSTAPADNESIDSVLEETKEEEQAKMSDELLTEMIQRIPSPVEIVALIKSSGAEYSEAYLNPAANAEKYTTSYQQAFNLGVYGADLGYINMYEKNISILSYLNAVKTMADQIKVGQFFDFNTLKRLSSNKENIDSLLFITTSNFNQMDAYLREQGRSDLSILSVAGAWLEGIYISCQVAKQTKNESLVERIGEQKIALKDIVLLLSQYKDEPAIEKVHADFTEIMTIFEDVKITQVDAAPETKEVDGKLVIVDNSSSEIEISNETLEAIMEIVTKVRNNSIN